MQDYVRVLVKSKLGETEEDFSARLSHFWTHMLRNFKADFEKVYAETTSFEEHAGRLSRQYAVEPDVASLLEGELARAELDHDPLDMDDLYGKYECAAPDWMQIEH